MCHGDADRTCAGTAANMPHCGHTNVLHPFAVAVAAVQGNFAGLIRYLLGFSMVGGRVQQVLPHVCRQLLAL